GYSSFEFPRNPFHLIKYLRYHRTQQSIVLHIQHLIALVFVNQSLGDLIPILLSLESEVLTQPFQVSSLILFLVPESMRCSSFKFPRHPFHLIEHFSHHCTWSILVFCFQQSSSIVVTNQVSSELIP